MLSRRRRRRVEARSPVAPPSSFDVQPLRGWLRMKAGCAMPHLASPCRQRRLPPASVPHPPMSPAAKTAAGRCGRVAPRPDCRVFGMNFDVFITCAVTGAGDTVGRPPSAGHPRRSPRPRSRRRAPGPPSPTSTCATRRPARPRATWRSTARRWSASAPPTSTW